MPLTAGMEFKMNDGTYVVTEVHNDDKDSQLSCLHPCLYILLEDMLESGNMVVGFDTEWTFFKGNLFTSNKLGHRIVLLKFCTKFGCVLVRLTAPGSVSPSLKQFLALKDAIFVGVHIKKDLEKLQDEYGLYVRNAVELSELAANVLGQPYLSALGARQLANKVLSQRFDMRPLTVICSNWFEESLRYDQIECATIDAYVTYKVGERILGYGYT